jgi:hypothetical protein
LANTALTKTPLPLPPPPPQQQQQRKHLLYNQQKAAVASTKAVLTAAATIHNRLSTAKKSLKRWQSLCFQTLNPD